MLIMKKDFAAPILVLTIICLIISGALAFTNSVTAPIIASAATQREEEARYEMIPEAEDFELVTVEGLPSTIKDVYRSTNDVGYIFMISTSGYGGDVRIICAIDAGGKIIRSMAIEQTETKGLGARIAEPTFAGQFDGADSSLSGVVAITGATISSTAYINAIKDAFTAFELVVGK